MMEPQTRRETPYVPAETSLPELTVRALILGLVMAVVLGFANAYLGLRAGMTISATFPAAVIAIAAFRLPFMRGSVLEQNIARTTARVGEALVAGALQTKYLNDIFVISRGDYENLPYIVFWCIAIGFVVPLSAIFIFGRRIR